MHLKGKMSFDWGNLLGMGKWSSMNIQCQGHFMVNNGQISGERSQDLWSSGLIQA